MPAGSSFDFVGIWDKVLGQPAQWDSSGNLMVNLADSAAGLDVGVTLQAMTCNRVTKRVTGTNATASAISAPGSNTAIQVRGFSVYNKSTNTEAEFSLLFGSTHFALGGVAPLLPFNWNMIGHYQQETNKKVVVKVVADSSVTLVWTIYYKEI